MSKSFLVFMCPKCRNFTNAPTGQSRRRCSYCGTIIDVTKAASALFDSPEKAAAAVKEFNASRGGKEFHEAVERSKDRVRALLPSKQFRRRDVVARDESDLPSGKSQRLMKLLEKEARLSPCSLDRIADVCPDYQLDWSWTEEQINKLANSGEIVFPRPWTIQLVGMSGEDSESKKQIIDVSHDILQRLKEVGGRSKVVEMIEHFKRRGVTEESVEASLDKLMNQGAIYVPKAGQIGLV